MIKEINTDLNAFEIYSLFKDEKNSFILDSGMDNEKLGRYSFVSSRPFDLIKLKNTKYNPLSELKEKLKKYKVINNTNLPFIGGAVGYLSYDLGNYIEKLPRTSIDDTKVYDLYFGFYNFVVVIDHLLNKKYIATPDIDKNLEKNILKEIEEKILNANKNEFKFELEECVEKVKLNSNFKKSDYINSIEKVREYIRQGDIYQANLTQRFSGKINMSSFNLYKRLRNISKAPFAAFLNFDDYQILSNSPERFIRCVDNIIQTRPIKGTRPRGNTKEEDMKLQNELRNSEKDKAELLMIVDLERNDLGKICEVGSVKVPELFVIEPYANVSHLVSTVTGKLKDGLDSIDVINATFPGGSITGAPKIRAMEIIDELEPTQRNVYTGSIGYIGFDGNMDFNIAIRTLIKKEEDIFFQVGGGITWDSNPEEEYQETLDKAKSIMKAIRGYYEE